MPSERHRHQLYEEAKQALSVESADELMSSLPPVGWADVATKDDVAMIRLEMDAFRAEIRGDMARLEGRLLGRTDRLDGRIDKLDGRIDRLDGRIDKLDGDLRAAIAEATDRMRVWMIATMLAFFVGIGGLLLGVAQFTR